MCCSRKCVCSPREWRRFRFPHPPPPPWGQVKSGKGGQFFEDSLLFQEIRCCSGRDCGGESFLAWYRNDSRRKSSPGWRELSRTRCAEVSIFGEVKCNYCINKLLTRRENTPVRIIIDYKSREDLCKYNLESKRWQRCVVLNPMALENIRLQNLITQIHQAILIWHKR